jgi:hypothetical protein
MLRCPSALRNLPLLVAMGRPDCPRILELKRRSTLRHAQHFRRRTTKTITTITARAADEDSAWHFLHGTGRRGGRAGGSGPLLLAFVWFCWTNPDYLRSVVAPLGFCSPVV